MASEVRNLIAGRWVDARSDRAEDIPDPATGETIAVLRHAGAEDVDDAVRAAADAQPAWGGTPVPERAQVLFRLKALLEDGAEDLARVIVRENGKTLDEARGEVRRGLEVVDFACGAPTLLAGSALDQVARGIDEELIRFPVGVVAAITPFNFPAMIPLWMLAPAVAAGNAVVLKPSQRTPLTGSRLGELLLEAGAPPGVVNVLHGAGETVDALLGHPGVDAVTFVGSAGVAGHVYATASAAGKRVQALGGAKNHIVVMDDADPAVTVPAVVSSAFGMAGQRCLAGSVVVGVAGAGEELAGALASAAGELRVGPGIDPDTDMGPVISGERVTYLAGVIEEGRAQGATVVSDGRDRAFDRGFFMAPSVIDDVTPDMRLWREELFGPVLSVIRAPDLDDALDTVNRSPFGNAAAIFTSSGRHAREFRRRAEAGMIGVNVGVAAPMAFFPFTGWKGSFYGDLHATGADAFRFFTRHKVITSRWP
ncbi:MAG: CoA-acylating methylmalonate-semialdehyde dehydrogenase [Actinomycetota bacterium]|nr:CoA-acylating methylmalonate-semialdehyde dehydrogenase [Actinomycetota bacterium]